MLEKLLKRFMSADGKVVLEALHKWAGHCIETETEQYSALEPIQMYDALIEYGSFIDRLILRRVKKSIVAHRKKQRALKKASETAMKILMGETFEETATGRMRSIHLGSPLTQAQQASALQQAYAQQQAYNQAAVAAGGSPARALGTQQITNFPYP